MATKMIDTYEKVTAADGVHMLWSAEDGRSALLCGSGLVLGCRPASPRDAVTCKECRRRAMVIVGGEEESPR